MASECNFAQAFRKKPIRRARSSCPCCQHSCSEITSARKPPKRRNTPGICRMEPSLTLEYHHIPDWSSPGPSIFRRIFQNEQTCQTVYIPKEILEYLIWANLNPSGSPHSRVLSPHTVPKFFVVRLVTALAVNSRFSTPCVSSRLCTCSWPLDLNVLYPLSRSGRAHCAGQPPEPLRGSRV